MMLDKTDLSLLTTADDKSEVLLKPKLGNVKF